MLFFILEGKEGLGNGTRVLWTSAWAAHTVGPVETEDSLMKEINSQKNVQKIKIIFT